MIPTLKANVHQQIGGNLWDVFAAGALGSLLGRKHSRTFLLLPALAAGGGPLGDGGGGLENAESAQVAQFVGKLDAT